MWPFDLFGNNAESQRKAVDEIMRKYRTVLQEETSIKSELIRYTQIRRRMLAIQGEINRITRMEDKEKTIQEWKQLHREEEAAAERLLVHSHHVKREEKRQEGAAKRLKFATR